MPFTRPPLAELIDRAVADIEAALPGTDARLRRSNLNVLARAHAASVHGLYGYLAWLSQQLLVDTAEAAMLERHAAIWGVLRVPAAYAAGAVTVTGTNGAVVPAGTLIRRSDGFDYASTADATVSAGTAVVSVGATVAGAAGNAGSGTQVSLVQPVPGVQSTGTVAVAGITQGADAESDGALRARVLMRIQQPPMGGSASDYVAWALQVPGVTRAWVVPLEGGPGTVTVRFVRDNDASFIPDGAEVTAVQAYIDERRPVTANVTVAAPTAVALNMTIGLTPNTVAVQQAVTAELQDLLRRVARPGGTIFLSQLREAVSVAAGEASHTMTVPSADVTHTAVQIATLGTITWV